MIDRVKIILPNLKHNPAAISDPELFREDASLPLYSSKAGFSGKSGLTTAVISPLADDIVRIVAVKTGGQWRAKSVEFNPGGLLHGHNGIPITTPTMLCAALSELVALLQLLLACPSDALRAIPGLSGSGAYWSSIEIPVNVVDFDRTLISASRGFTHPSIRNEAFSREMSRKLPGTHLKLNSYCKDLESGKLRKKFDATEESPEIYRLEFTLSGPKLKHYFRFPGDKLTRFRLMDLRAVHMEIAGEICGFFATAPGASKSTKAARTIAVMVRNGRGSPDELIGDHLQANTPCDNTRRDLIKMVSAALEETSSISLKELLDDQAYFDQPAVRIPKLEESARQRWLRTDIDPRIVAVYGGGHLWPKQFMPHVYDEQLNNDDYYHRVIAQPRRLIATSGYPINAVYAAGHEPTDGDAAA